MSHNDLITVADLVRCEEALRLAIEHGQWDTLMTAQVRSLVGEDSAAMVMATANLQHKARAKLGDGIWWCTERSLRQSTPYQVADLKARWIGTGTIHDLCCGIGADTIAIARVQRAGDSLITAIDRDPMMAAMASENLRLSARVDHSAISIECVDVENRVIPGNNSVHIDPDRRDESGRKTRPDDYSPSWETVDEIVERCEGAIVKLAPAAEIADRAQRHRIWISLSGSVREQTLLANSSIDRASADLGLTLNEAGRSAVVVNRDGRVSHFPGEMANSSARASSAAWTKKPMMYMVDPDAAIRAAGLTESFAVKNGLQMLGGPAGFLTGEVSVDSDLAICEPVIWSGACDDRKLRKTLRSMDSYPWRVKTRGVSQNPNVLEKRYRQCGQRPVTLWIGKGNKRQYAVMTATG